MKKRIFTLLCSLLLPLALSGQNVALKTNLLHWATVAPNAAIEVGLGKSMTLDLYGAIMPFQIAENNIKWKHWIVQPELRFWFCEKFNGFYIGIHGQGGQMNFGKLPLPPVAYTFDHDMINGLKDNRYEGWFAGGGISLGYHWVVCKRLNIEFSLGGGYNHLWYKQYEGEKCGRKKGDGKNHYIGPTKGTISFVFLLD